MTVDHRVAELALERATGDAFESFFKAFFAAVYGSRFVPAGGMHDGGLDAYLDGVFEHDGKAGTFFQASTQKGHGTKIRGTVERLVQSGRAPRTLIYCTSIVVRNIDKQEELLSDELGATIRIRDRQYIVAHVNHSEQTQQAFFTYLFPQVNFIQHVGQSGLANAIPSNDQRALFVFLQQELARRNSNANMINSVTDSLILWSLEGTDPDHNLFLSRSAILQKIEEILPTSRSFVRGNINHRLADLSSKRAASGRQIQYHQKRDGYCLPYATRQIVESENASDALLRDTVSQIFAANARDALGSSADKLTDVVVSLCHLAVEKAFYSQGLEVAAFFSENSGFGDAQLTLSDYVDQAMTEAAGAQSDSAALKVATLSVLRKAFYESTPDERIYFQKLSRTFALFFSLRADARVLDYFRSMSTKFLLYVGADIFVRSISERYLRPEDRVTTILLEMLRKSGATLVLSQTAFEEVYSHICGTDYEFTNWYEGIEPHVSVDIARHCSKILIRAFFYAKRRPPNGIEPPKNWSHYLDQFVTRAKLHTDAGKDEFLRYLCERYNLEFETTDTMVASIEEGQLDGLTELLREAKPDKSNVDLLAYNDALQILRVYSKRREVNDTSQNSTFGFRVWWLTHETHVMRATSALVKHYNARYIMRPEFVLNFIALAPSTNDVAIAYESVFPSLLAIKLSNRMKDGVLHELLQRAQEAAGYDDARIAVKMQDLSNRLKGDNYKQYEVALDQSQFMD